MLALCKTVTEQPQPIHGTAQGELWTQEQTANVSKLQKNKRMDSGAYINEK